MCVIHNLYAIVVRKHVYDNELKKERKKLFPKNMIFHRRFYSKTDLYMPESSKSYSNSIDALRIKFLFGNTQYN